MNRSELVAELSARFPELAFGDTEAAVALLLVAIASSAASGRRIEFRGFGSFKTKIQPPRKARNPRTGESVQMDAKRVLHFKPSKNLRELTLAMPPTMVDAEEDLSRLCCNKDGGLKRIGQKLS